MILTFKHKIMLSGLPLLVLIVGAGCAGDQPFAPNEATDEEAIYNIFFIDYRRLGELEILPAEVPDTLAFMANPDTLRSLHWHVLDSTDETFGVDISDQPVDSEVGPVYQADVTYVKIWRGTFETLRYNFAEDSLERFSQTFRLQGTRDAICQKWGITQQRRGWRAISFGDAVFVGGGGHDFLQDLRFHAESRPESIFVYGIYKLNEIMRFDPGEPVTVAFRLTNATDLPYMFIPFNNTSYEMAELSPDSAGVYRVQFGMPTVSGLYGQLRFLVVDAFDVTANYHAVGYSFNYGID